MALLTVREAAGRLGVGYSTLKQWIYKGSVRTTRTEGGHYRISDEEVDRLLAGRGAPDGSALELAVEARRRESASGRGEAAEHALGVRLISLF